MSLMVMTMTSFHGGTDVNLRGFSFDEFTKDDLFANCFLYSEMGIITFPDKLQSV